MRKYINQNYSVYALLFRKDYLKRQLFASTNRISLSDERLMHRAKRICASNLNSIESDITTECIIQLLKYSPLKIKNLVYIEDRTLQASGIRKLEKGKIGFFIRLILRVVKLSLYRMVFCRLIFSFAITTFFL